MADTPYIKPTWLAEGDEKRTRVKAMFGQMAGRYDLLNGLMSLWMHNRWRRVAVDKLQLGLGDSVVDLCCGTGSFVMPIRRKVGATGSILGLDFCQPMLKKAAENYPSKANFALGDALNLPLAADSADALSVGWGIRNLSDVDAAHREIFRVLKPGKRFVSIDMAQPKNGAVRAVSGFLFVNIVPRMAGAFGLAGEYMYLPKSTERFKSREELVGSMTKAGFTQVGWQDAMFGNICIHWGLKP